MNTPQDLIHYDVELVKDIQNRNPMKLYNPIVNVDFFKILAMETLLEIGHGFQTNILYHSTTIKYTIMFSDSK